MRSHARPAKFFGGARTTPKFKLSSIARKQGLHEARPPFIRAIMPTSPSRCSCRPSRASTLTHRSRRTPTSTAGFSPTCTTLRLAPASPTVTRRARPSSFHRRRCRPRQPPTTRAAHTSRRRRRRLMLLRWPTSRSAGESDYEEGPPPLLSLPEPPLQRPRRQLQSGSGYTDGSLVYPNFPRPGENWFKRTSDGCVGNANCVGSATNPLITHRRACLTRISVFERFDLGARAPMGLTPRFKTATSYLKRNDGEQHLASMRQW